MLSNEPAFPLILLTGVLVILTAGPPQAATRSHPKASRTSRGAQIHLDLGKRAGLLVRVSTNVSPDRHFNRANAHPAFVIRAEHHLTHPTVLISGGCKSAP